LLSGYFSSLGLVIIMSACLAIYGVVSFEESETTDQLQSSKGWKKFTSGWFIGATGGASFAFMLLSNVPMF
jgi:photosystem I subunit 11